MIGNLLKIFSDFVWKADFSKNQKERKVLSGLGLAGESGEVVDIIKKHVCHGKEIDRDHLVEELGDVFWHFQLTLNTFDISFEEVITGNIEKLCKRYPEKNGDAKEWLQGYDI